MQLFCKRVSLHDLIFEFLCPLAKLMKITRILTVLGLCARYINRIYSVGLVSQLNMISRNHQSSKEVYFLLSSWTTKTQKKGYSEHPSPRNLKKMVFHRIGRSPGSISRTVCIFWHTLIPPSLSIKRKLRVQQT